MGSQLAYIVLLIQSTLTFLSIESSSVFQMRNWKLKAVKRLTDGHTNSVNQGLLMKPVVFGLFREINPKLKGGVMCYSFCNSITY